MGVSQHTSEEGDGEEEPDRDRHPVRERPHQLVDHTAGEAGCVSYGRTFLTSICPTLPDAPFFSML